MEIQVNQITQIVTEHISVEALMQGLFPEGTKGLAVAINDHVVSRADWPGKKLTDNDRVTLIRATQGG